MKLGTPGIYSEEFAASIVKSIAGGMPEVHAAEMHKIHRSTLHDWKKRFPAFADAIKTARAEAMNGRLQVIMDAAKGGAEYETQETVHKAKDGSITKKVVKKKTAPNWTAAAWYLERQYCEQFGLNRLDLKELLQLLRAAKKDRLEQT